MMPDELGGERQLILDMSAIMTHADIGAAIWGKSGFCQQVENELAINSASSSLLWLPFLVVGAQPVHVEARNRMNDDRKAVMQGIRLRIEQG